MRDFSWNYFSKTGDVNAYLLYKESLTPEETAAPLEELQEQEEGEAVV